MNNPNDVSKIEISGNDTTISLSMEQAKELNKFLSEIFRNVFSANVEKQEFKDRLLGVKLKHWEPSILINTKCSVIYFEKKKLSTAE